MESPKPYREKRPWGDELWLVNDKAPVMVKVITVNPGQALSLQYHNNRDEFWHVISGSGTAVVGDDSIGIKAGNDYFVPRGIKHRVESGADVLFFIELSFGEFDEEDIVRLEDRYGRA